MQSKNPFSENHYFNSCYQIICTLPSHVTFSHHNLSNYVIEKAVLSGVNINITKPIFGKGGHADPGYHLTPLRTNKIQEKADRDRKHHAVVKIVKRPHFQHIVMNTLMFLGKQFGLLNKKCMQNVFLLCLYDKVGCTPKNRCHKVRTNWEKCWLGVHKSTGFTSKGIQSNMKS